MTARVLVVDDEETVMLTLQGVLELDGYDVTASSSGEHAIELVRTQHFDLVLTDLRLDNGVDGIDILRELRRQSIDSVSIMLTGYSSLDSAVKALREGAYDYLLKPCDVLELRATVSRGLERSQHAADTRDRVTQLERANDEFMARVAHDLKAPITFIKGMATLRRRRAVSTPETQPLLDALEQIDASAGRMARQLDELVNASRRQAGPPPC
jgi:DNA-binding NtrC family response regulator